MAGESPERSKQRESSAEPASGSAAPVPESRDETRGARDPRLSMTGKSGADARRAGVDTATKVLSVPAPAKDTRGAEEAKAAEDVGNGKDAENARDAEDADAARGEDAEDAAGTSGQGGASGRTAAGDESRDAATGSEGEDTPDAAGEAGSDDGDHDGGGARPEAKGLGDARLRAAVAAWVNSADTADAKDSAGSEEDSAGAEDAGETAEARGGADGPTGAGTKSAADGTAKAADARDEGAAGTTADSGTNAAAPEEISAAAPATAAPVTAAASKTAADPKASGELKDADDADTLRDKAASGDDKRNRTDATDRNDAAAATTAAGPEAEGGPRPGAGTGARDSAREGGDQKHDDEHDDKRDEKRGQDEDQHDDQGGRGEDRDGEGAGESAGAAGTGSDAERPVDQPTTMLKLGAAAKPRVDQPTTMLKLGGAAKSPQKKAPASPQQEPGSPKPTPEPAKKAPEPAKKAPEPAKKADEPAKKAAEPARKADEPAKKADEPAKKAGEPAKAGESEAERTSRFVALKPLDDPATRKPKPGTADTAGTAGPAGSAAPASSPSPSAPAPAPAVPADATRPVPQIGPERTTQQPLPPKPPLDLLAELTNTPPPPPTPLRTFARRVKIWTPLVILLLIVFAVVQTLRPLPAPTLDLTAKETYTFDGGKADIPWPSDGQGALDVQGIGTFGSSGGEKPAPIASVAKVMTAYLILRDHPLKSGDGEKIKVDELAERQATADGESTVKVHAGDTITEREALEGVLIASANNVARLLARWDAGSEKAFVGKMNDAAERLGMTNTTYTDPSGLEKTTVSTAVDQVKLAKAAMKDPAFRDIARMMEYTDYKGTKHPNWNRLVGSNGVIGIKTGTTTAAGGNLVFAATKKVGDDTKTIVGAVLSQGPGGEDNTILSGALDAADQLIRAAQDALKPATILKKGDVVGYVDDGLGGRTPVAVTEDVTAVGWAGLEVKLSFASDEVPHVAKAGTRVATLTVGDGGTSGAVQVPVALTKDLVEPAWTDKLTRVA
ncbi:D-alanyl-D-alanine carboxypeptidase [Streptomyces sp. NPDC046831]|uniref:D-alanyl-D-alanine carboxypeptidase n=1 Tax=Streptomyces sp. NPDC046831 TaxID=3154805 RepID=UPI0033CA40C7